MGPITPEAAVTARGPELSMAPEEELLEMEPDPVRGEWRRGGSANMIASARGHRMSSFNRHEHSYSTLAIQESTLGRSGKDGEAPSGNLVKSGGEVDITKLLSLLCRCNKALMWLPFSC
jgi:hypothetical protein